MLVVLFLLFLVIRILVAAIISGIADTFAGFALADLIVNLLTVPISGLAASVIYFELKGLHGEPIPGAAPGGALETAASGVAPEPSGGTSMPPAPPPGSGPAPAPQPGSPPPAAPPPGGSPPAGGDPGRRRAGRRRRRTPDAYRSFAAARKTLGQLAPQLVLGRDAGLALSPELLGVLAGRDGIGIAFPVVQPRTEVAPRDLGVELESHAGRPSMRKACRHTRLRASATASAAAAPRRSATGRLRTRGRADRRAGRTCLQA